MMPQSSTIVAASPTTSAEIRIGAYNWEALGNELDSYGCAVLPNLLSREECRAIAALYREESYFRSRVHMARHGFGKGSIATSNIRSPNPSAPCERHFIRSSPALPTNGMAE